jgi:hypothetical protein
MKFKKPLFLLISLLLCLSSAASSFAIDVKTDFDRATDFGRPKPSAGRKSKHEIHCGRPSGIRQSDPLSAGARPREGCRQFDTCKSDHPIDQPVRGKKCERRVR